MYAYSRESVRLVVRVPTAVHELLIARVEDAVFNQLESIREGSGDAAASRGRCIRPGPQKYTNTLPGRERALNQVKTRAECVFLARRCTIPWGHHRSRVLAEEEEVGKACRRLSSRLGCERASCCWPGY